jgi:hypothetical protein
MPNRNLIKGECRLCAGHLEFPASAAGQIVPCPHCGQNTELTELSDPVPRKPAAGRRRTGLGLGVAVLLLAVGGAGAFLFGHKTAPTGLAESPPATASPATNFPVNPVPVVAVAAPKPAPPAAAVAAPEPVVQTNDFALLPFTLEKTPGSSLVYVVGHVRNLTDRQRFGVKLEFGLFDLNDHPIGSATDYQSVMEPHSEWRFKALVMESLTATARLDSITEDK